MVRVALVNMPFANWNRPSPGLSQLASLIRREYPNDVDAEIYYVNQDLASRMGHQTYDPIAYSVGHLFTGLGDWLFRQVAFPELPDNTDQYFERYYSQPGWRKFRNE